MGEYDTKEAVSALGEPSDEFKQLLQDSPLPAGEILSLATTREQTNALEQSIYDSTPTLGTSESVITVAMRDGSPNEIRLCKPTLSLDSRSPLVTLIYGGGFMLGTNKQLIQFARLLASVYNVTTALLSYRLSPEYKFPTAPNDIWDSIQWLKTNAVSIGADLSRGFVIGGVSAGGTLAVVTAHRAVKENLSPPFTGVWACIPALVDEQTVPDNYKDLWFSRAQNADAPFFGAKQLASLVENYAPGNTEQHTPFANMDTFGLMPRTFVQVCGMDPLRDDGLVYERALRDHGVETRLAVYPGVPHAHWVAFPKLKASELTILDTNRGMGWLLGQEPQEQKLIEAATQMGLASHS